MAFHPDFVLGGIDVLRLLLGGLLFLFPGIVWTWALTPGIAWAYRVPLSIVAAFTVQPGIMMFLNLVLRVPVNLTTTALLCSVLGLTGIMMLLRRLEPRWDPDENAPSRPGHAAHPRPAEAAQSRSSSRKDDPQ